MRIRKFWPAVFLLVMFVGTAWFFRQDVSEGAQAQQEAPIDISRYEIWVPTDSSFICNKRGECAWIPPGSLLLTPAPRPVPKASPY